MITEIDPALGVPTLSPSCANFLDGRGLDGFGLSLGTMSYYVVIRGPLGVGKSAVSRKLAQRIGAVYISIDQILDDQGLWESGRLSEFLRANDFVISRARASLDRGVPVVIDGNFYWKSQIRDLVGRLRGHHYVVTLKAPLKVCIARDGGREPSHGRKAARQVYAKSTRFEYGIGLDATGPIEPVVRQLIAMVSAIPAKPTPRIAP